MEQLVWGDLINLRGSHISPLTKILNTKLCTYPTGTKLALFQYSLLVYTELKVNGFLIHWELPEDAIH